MSRHRKSSPILCWKKKEERARVQRAGPVGTNPTASGEGPGRQTSPVLGGKWRKGAWCFGVTARSFEAKGRRERTTGESRPTLSRQRAAGGQRPWTPPLHTQTPNSTSKAKAQTQTIQRNHSTPSPTTPARRPSWRPLRPRTRAPAPTSSSPTATQPSAPPPTSPTARGKRLRGTGMKGRRVGAS